MKKTTVFAMAIIAIACGSMLFLLDFYTGQFIEEIAYTLGYTDIANFRRAFKRWEGMPPAQFRERHGRG